MKNHPPISLARTVMVLVFLAIVQWMGVIPACPEMDCRITRDYPFPFIKTCRPHTAGHHCCPNHRGDAKSRAALIPSSRGWTNAAAVFDATCLFPNPPEPSAPAPIHINFPPKISIFVLNQTFLC